jgi:hypothetical protein
VEASVAKSFFESNYSHVYSILYESFLAAETNLKQKSIWIHEKFIRKDALKKLFPQSKKHTRRSWT